MNEAELELRLRHKIAAEIADQADLRAAVHTDPDDPMQSLIEGMRFAARIARGELHSPR